MSVSGRSQSDIIVIYHSWARFSPPATSREVSRPLWTKSDFLTLPRRCFRPETIILSQFLTFCPSDTLARWLCDIYRRCESFRYSSSREHVILFYAETDTLLFEGQKRDQNDGFGSKSSARKSGDVRLGPEWAGHLPRCCGRADTGPGVIDTSR